MYYTTISSANANPRVGPPSLKKHRDRFAAGREVARSLRFAGFSSFPPRKTLGGDCPTVVINSEVEYPTGTTESAEFAEIDVRSPSRPSIAWSVSAVFGL